MSDLSPFDTDQPAPARIPPSPFSPPRQALFLDALSDSGNVRLACAAAAISPQTAYRARRSNPAFAQVWDAALLLAREVVAQVLADRALNGVEEPIFYRGDEIGHRRRYDSRLLLAHLARLDRLAERAEASEGLDDFDAALAMLASGEDLEPARPAAGAIDEEEDIPELEAAMRMLEAQGWVDVEGEWVFQGEGQPDPSNQEEKCDHDGVEDPSFTALTRRAPQAHDGGVSGDAAMPAETLEDGDENLLPPDPHDFRRFEKGVGARRAGGGKSKSVAPPPTRLQRATSPKGGGV